MILHGVTSVLPGCDVPGAVLTNARLADLVDEVRADLRRRGIDDPRPACAAEFPAERIGIEQRRVLDATSSVRDLAVTAAQRAVDAAGVDGARIRCVLVTTATPDQLVPALATTVHEELGLATDATAVDVTMGCSGFVAALDLADRFLATCPRGSLALVLAAEAMTRVMDAGDRNTCVVFGDGAGAALVEPDPARGRAVTMRTWGSCGPRIVIGAPAPSDELPAYRFVARAGRVEVRSDRSCQKRVVMDGRAVFRDMVRLVPETLATVLGDRLNDMDAFALHQANARLLESVADAPALQLDPERFLLNIATVGNTSSASIPILLAQARAAGRLAPGSRVALCGFGSGYSIGVAEVEVA
ncbi:MAG: ketoacyl-ACP synthase III [Planctomycetota bacterium]